ncbi:MAG: hypothetical protein WB985_15780 [Candidatus Acidiferrales bacterium]
MKVTRWAGILVLGALFIPAGVVRAQASGGTQAGTSSGQSSQALEDQDIALLRKDIGSKKKQLVAANLKLSDAEATKFWPVYDQYTADLIKINNEKYAVIKEYANSFGSITDAQALDLTKRALAADQHVAQLRESYIPKFAVVLPGKKVATFYQIERRLQQMIDLQLTGQFPLVQDQQQ